MNDVTCEEKKVILFLVEGPTDENSLGMILQKILKDKKIFFHIIYTDLTSENQSNVQNILKKIEEEIKKECSIQYFFLSDIMKIIQLVDTDGAFIRDSLILEEDVEHAIYTAENIKTKHLSEMKKRNLRKSGILNFLISQNNILDIPYKVYYFSCNLEHVLHNEQNLPQEEKGEFADVFSEKFYGKPQEFIDFICDKEFAVEGSYVETWNFIKQDTHSLKRYTNFQLFFDEDK